MLLYNFVILLYGLGVKIASLRKTKAKQWVNGRKNWQYNLLQKVNQLQSKQIIWMHCASYGEFEQGRPLIESIKKNYPSYKFVLTFFSPSGYEAFKDWKGADIICYLPLDTKSNAIQFLDIVKPQHAIFIKYEFWVNFLKELKQKNIPTYLVSAVFKPHHPFFRWYGGIFKKSLYTFNKLFIQDEKSAELLKSINILNYEVCGDTRFDRVIEIKRNFEPLPYFEKFCNTSSVFIAGSSWAGDEELILEAYKQLNSTSLKLIIVPHDVDEKNISRLKELLSFHGFSFSVFSEQKETSDSQILIVDTIGLLNKIYHYATLTYIGGGFNGGIHNTLEPAVHLKPVFFSDVKYTKFNEAVDLINLGVAFNIDDSKDLKNKIENYLNNPQLLNEAKEKLTRYFEKNGGSTLKIINSLNLG
ncbi:MAG: glycosyltransferase N-terminal domain-containing protein [Bacteroidota bacterium]|nr:glycosyltransferase N-terminal domain-containing protein [Bacteroidota bacterium]